MGIAPINQALRGHIVAAGLQPRKRLPYVRASGARRIPRWGAFSVITLVHKNFRSGEACIIKLLPGQEIRTAQGLINDIRWRLDFEDPSEPVIRTGTAKVIRLCSCGPTALSILSETSRCGAARSCPSTCAT